LVRSLRRALHRRSRIACRLLRARRTGAGSRAQVGGDPVDAARQRVRAIGKRALARATRAVRPRRVLAIPLRLAPLQVLGVGRERRERASTAARRKQLLLRSSSALSCCCASGEPLERRGAVGAPVEPGQRVLQLAQPRCQLGVHGRAAAAPRRGAAPGTRVAIPAAGPRAVIPRGRATGSGPRC